MAWDLSTAKAKYLEAEASNDMLWGDNARYRQRIVTIKKVFSNEATWKRLGKNAQRMLIDAGVHRSEDGRDVSSDDESSDHEEVCS